SFQPVTCLQLLAPDHPVLPQPRQCLLRVQSAAGRAENSKADGNSQDASYWTSSAGCTGRQDAMDRHGGWRRILAACLLTATLVCSGGCMPVFNPVHAPPEELTEPCKVLPQACRSHVYVFIVNGMDPCDWSNLSGLRDYLHTLGFNKV